MRRATRQDGMVLIVVVGVLAVMSIMAFTFARYMMIERRASENRGHLELAREMAKAGLEHMKEVLAGQVGAYPGGVSEYDGMGTDWWLMAQPDNTPLCPLGSHPDNYGCRTLYEGDGVAGSVSFHDHDSDRTTPSFDSDRTTPSFFHGAGIADEDAKFNINVMGFLGDVGDPPEAPLTSFDASFVRFLIGQLSGLSINFAGTEDFYEALAVRIVDRRYGADTPPDPESGFVPDDEHNAELGNTYRLYRSVAEVAPVIREAIRELASAYSLTLDGETVDAGDVESLDRAASRVFRALEDGITAHSRAWTPASVNINADWSSDGFDNTGDGVIDGPDELNWNDIQEDLSLTTEEQEERFEQRTERLVALRRKLGLVRRNEQTGEYEINADHGLSIREANQLLVNVVDFMDENNYPTWFDRDADGATVLNNKNIVAGTGGVHVTEIMGTPRPLRNWSFGITQPTEEPYWAWNNAPLPDPTGYYHGNWDGYYEVIGDVPGPGGELAVARLDFSGTVKRGWYAFRILAGKAGAANVNLRIGYGATQPADGEWWTVPIDSDDDQWFYPRDDDGNLRILEVSAADTLQFWIRVDDLIYAPGAGGTPERIRFYGIQLLPQFVELTNIVLEDENNGGGVDLQGHELTHFPQPEPVTGYPAPPPDANTTVLFSGGNEAHYWDEDASVRASTTYIPPARLGTPFPLHYGRLVVAVSEAAYDMNFGNHSETWGDDASEAYPAFFVGDQLDDAAIERFLLGLEGMHVTLGTPAGILLAGAEVDFPPNEDTATGEWLAPVGVDLEEYISKEKVSIVSPNDPNVPWWGDSRFGFDNRAPSAPIHDLDFLRASQNVLIWVPEDTDFGITAAYPVRSSINSRSTWGEDAGGNPLHLWSWDVGNNIPQFYDCTYLITDNSVALPFILNRPYPNPAWLAFVPSGVPFRNVGPDADHATAPAGPQEMLGRLMMNAMVGRVHARVNVNTAEADVLRAIMPPVFAQELMDERPFYDWDQLFLWALDDPDRLGQFLNSATLMDIRSHTFRTRVDGFVFEREQYRRPLAQARLEAVIDRGRDTDGDRRPDVRVLEKRWIPIRNQ